MKITRGYKTELDLTNRQITACKQHAGVSRFAYNWGLKRKQEVYKQTGRSICAMELHRELNVEGMKRNRTLALSISDVGMGEFRRQMAYKSRWQGETFLLAHRWYPSTKKCCSV